MPDIHIERHGDRWAVRESGDESPIFESYTLEEAESEARRLAGDGRVSVSGADDEPEGLGQGRVHDGRDDPAPGRGAEGIPEQQGGL